MVQPQLVKGGNVVHILDDIEISPVGRKLKPAVYLNKTKLLDLGLIAIFDITDSKGKLFWSKGAETRGIQVPLLLADAEIGDVIELDGGREGETQVKVAAIKTTLSVGVTGKRDTIGATLRFVLREHAPELGGEAGGGGAA
jgi:hypothetical protein